MHRQGILAVENRDFVGEKFERTSYDCGSDVYVQAIEQSRREVLMKAKSLPNMCPKLI